MFRSSYPRTACSHHLSPLLAVNGQFHTGFLLDKKQHPLRSHVLLVEIRILNPRRGDAVSIEFWMPIDQAVSRLLGAVLHVLLAA